jgi:hypothetical protein
MVHELHFHAAPPLARTFLIATSLSTLSFIRTLLIATPSHSHAVIIAINSPSPATTTNT